MMTNIPLTTEGRIYARQVLREVKRREPIGASAFGAGSNVSTWDAGTSAMFRRMAKGIDVFTKNALLNTQKRLQAIPREDRGYVLNRHAFDLVTLTAGGHTLTAIEDLEEGIIVQRHHLEGDPYYVGMVLSNISEHALGRYYERSVGKPDVQTGIDLAYGTCGQLGMYAASQAHLGNSQIYIPIDDDLYVTGSMKIGTYPDGKWATAFFDCRTVLPAEALDPPHIEQANIIWEVLGGGTAEAKDIPALPRRPDFVLDMIAQSRKPLN